MQAGSSGSALFVAGAGLLVAVGWSFLRIFGGPEELSEDILLEDLRRSAASLVEEIEAFRTEEGRLPDEEELLAEELIGADIDEGLEYVRTDDGYVVRLTEEALRAFRAPGTVVWRRRSTDFYLSI